MRGVYVNTVKAKRGGLRLQKIEGAFSEPRTKLGPIYLESKVRKAPCGCFKLVEGQLKVPIVDEDDYTRERAWLSLSSGHLEASYRKYRGWSG